MQQMEISLWSFSTVKSIMWFWDICVSLHDSVPSTPLTKCLICIIILTMNLLNVLNIHSSRPGSEGSSLSISRSNVFTVS